MISNFFYPFRVWINSNSIQWVLFFRWFIFIFYINKWLHIIFGNLISFIYFSSLLLLNSYILWAEQKNNVIYVNFFVICNLQFATLFLLMYYKLNLMHLVLLTINCLSIKYLMKWLNNISPCSWELAEWTGTQIILENMEPCSYTVG